MSHTIHLHRALTAAACISAALCLSACGGSSKSGSEAGSHTSTAAAQASSATKSSSGTATTDSTTTTTATRSLSPAARAHARRAALTSFAVCLQKHGIPVPSQDLSGANPAFDLKGIDTKTARYQRVAGACLRSAAAAYSSATAAGR
jgi:hypothetical protein